MTQIHQSLRQLKEQHRDIDEQIRQLNADKTNDQLLIQRLKKQKLALRDNISRIEASTLPNIIA